MEVTSVELDGEAVVYAGSTGNVHKLDRIATVIWNSLDGSVTLADLVEELSDVFVDDDPERIAADLQAYVEELARQGLLDPVTDADPANRRSGE